MRRGDAGKEQGQPVEWCPWWGEKGGPIVQAHAWWWGSFSLLPLFQLLTFYTSDIQAKHMLITILSGHPLCQQLHPRSTKFSRQSETEKNIRSLKSDRPRFESLLCVLRWVLNLPKLSSLYNTARWSCWEKEMIHVQKYMVCCPARLTITIINYSPSHAFLTTCLLVTVRSEAGGKVGKSITAYEHVMFPCTKESFLWFHDIVKWSGQLKKNWFFPYSILEKTRAGTLPF